MAIVTVNVSAMFSKGIDPYDCSNCIANLGQNAGEITWRRAMLVAADYLTWLETPVSHACESIRRYARDTGAWSDADEVESWSTVECMALLVQILAGELRDLGSDDSELSLCVEVFGQTDWDKEPQSPTAVYYVDGSGAVKAEWMPV